ncbi:sn-glycerol-3-phosphate ABC transporter ATP-binding protein UgpC [Methylobrevis pamukkalensis]|uniref:sn-glycerol-3-phosphate import ATP-binding protein UgpC n=1 Tax=Methylobrevis pamukkalensis TaxID=1439726 RepID=A0A1E3H662_9HYPH|nr:sn-glycerol-3-phosphate ABC transporter ATP-binding protein UgpC [Methylobrevis pamukkalensis]ODN71828.1 sn-glycerol-3-phosphate import ATP-binding protein UgpC [Methylobrevis pamukkalensis]
MAAIELQDVRKVYAGNVEAVKGVSLSIPDGAFAVLVGPSGCGKSTLLRMVAGLEAITSGTVSIGGRVVNDLEPAERDIAMVFQNYALYPHMTVRRNLEYGLRNRRTPAEEIARRVDEAARILDIAGLLDRRPGQLSGGQRQRVAMGRAIVREPAAFLFDEPLSNLDAKLRVAMRAEIRRLQRRLRTTSLYVTHDQLEAMTLADVLVVLNAGRIEQSGTPMELYERPASLFVATFIGSPAMNVIPHGAAVAAGLVPQGAPEATLGIRPEHMRLVEGLAASGDEAVVDLEVSGVEVVGAESYVTGRLGSSAVEISVRVPGHSRLEPGTPMRAAGGRAAFLRFDPQSGARISAVSGA